MLKKLLVPVMVGVLVLVNTMVFAEDIDVSSFSVEELIQLRNEISSYTIEELVKLRNDIDNLIAENDGKVVIQYGDYVVGNDIAAGNYVISIFSLEGEDSSGGAYVTVQKYEGAAEDLDVIRNKYYEAHEKIEAGEDADLPEIPDMGEYYALEEELIKTGQSLKIKLEDGEVLQLRDWTGKIAITIEQVDKGLFMD